MVKLFGWEEKMSERIASKRSVELKASRIARLLELGLVVIRFDLLVNIGRFCIDELHKALSCRLRRC